MEFVKADITDIEEISRLYDDVCDYLCEHENYPGWKKGVYPTKDDACAGIKERSLYIARYNNKIVGAVILQHTPEDGYKNVEWDLDSNYEKIYVICSTSGFYQVRDWKEVTGFYRRTCQERRMYWSEA